MIGLLRSLTDIALLRKDPSGLPSSRASVALFVLVYAAADFAVGRVGGIPQVLQRTALDLALTLAFFWLLLALTRRVHRLPQTINAALGVYVLLSPIVAALLLLRVPATNNQGLGLFVTAGYTLFMIWYLLIVGHILRSALDSGLVTGFAIAVAWTVAIIAISQRVFGAAA
ncbi:MAG: hypothetical protein ACREST_04905 [Steroidobacteraceae bacterium]